MATTKLHSAIITPDDRYRFGLGKFIDRNSALDWLVFVEDDGRTIRLEAIDQTEKGVTD